MTPDELKEGLRMAGEKARKNLVDFRHICLHQDGDVEPAPFHYQWSDMLLENDENFAIEAFRESAKSQYVLRAFPLYCLTFPSVKRDYVVIIKKNATLANNKLKEITREYLANPLISQRLVKIYDESGEVFNVDVKNEDGDIINVRIEAYGKGGSIRGLSHKDRRPKICILDDIQGSEDSDSETIQETDWTWFLSDVMFLGQKTRIFLIGNNLGERSIIERVFADADSLKFKTMRIPCIIDGKPSWSAKYTLEEIETEKDNFRKLGKLNIWLKEKMCEAISDETRTFLKEDFRYYSPSLMPDLIPKCNIFIAVDLAISEKHTADYTAIMVVGINSENHWFIFDCVYGRFDPSQTIDHIFNLVKKWRPMIVGIEKVAFQRALIHFVMKEMPARDCFFAIKELEAEKQKELRIKSLQPRFRAKTMWLPEYASWLTEMESELLRFPKGLHDDLIDALAYIPTFSYPKNKYDAFGRSLNKPEFANTGTGLEFANQGVKYSPLKGINAVQK